MWEPGGDRLSEDLSQVGCKISRAEVLWAVTLLPSLAPAEWDTCYVITEVIADLQTSELSFVLVGLLCSRTN